MSAAAARTEERKKSPKGFYGFASGVLNRERAGGRPVNLARQAQETAALWAGTPEELKWALYNVGREQKAARLAGRAVPPLPEELKAAIGRIAPRPPNPDVLRRREQARERREAMRSPLSRVCKGKAEGDCKTDRRNCVWQGKSAQFCRARPISIPGEEPRSRKSPFRGIEDPAECKTAGGLWTTPNFGCRAFNYNSPRNPANRASPLGGRSPSPLLDLALRGARAQTPSYDGEYEENYYDSRGQGSEYYDSRGQGYEGYYDSRSQSSQDQYYDREY